MIIFKYNCFKLKTLNIIYFCYWGFPTGAVPKEYSLPLLSPLGGEAIPSPLGRLFQGIPASSGQAPRGKQGFPIPLASLVKTDGPYRAVNFT